MKNLTRYIAILILLTVLAACKIDSKQLLDSQETLTIETHELNGISKGNKEIRKGEETYSRLKKWLEENEKGWEPSLVTFVPSIVVRGKKFNLNFHSRRAILNFQSQDGQWHQYVKGITEADFQYLLPK
jgi:hypothetical protein